MLFLFSALFSVYLSIHIYIQTTTESAQLYLLLLCSVQNSMYIFCLFALIFKYLYRAHIFIFTLHSYWYVYIYIYMYVKPHTVTVIFLTPQHCLIQFWKPMQQNFVPQMHYSVFCEMRIKWSLSLSLYDDHDNKYIMI